MITVNRMKARIRDLVADDVKHGDLDLEWSDTYEYAHEFADNAEWVINTAQAIELWNDAHDMNLDNN